MNEYRNNVKKVQKALNQDAAFIQPNPYLAQHVLSTANQENIKKSIIAVRKKHSVSIIIAIILMLFAITAIAATFLTPSEVVQETALPIAVASGNYDETPNFSKEELATILLVAEENNIHLSEYWYTALEGEKGAPKDELIKALAVSEFGDYMSWTIEEQHWLGEVLVLIGAQESNYYYLPSSGELSYAAALSNVSKYIMDNYSDDVLNESRWKPSVEYSSRIGLSEDYSEVPIWWFYFRPISLSDPSYEVCMSNDGVILSCYVKTHNVTSAADIDIAFSEVYGSVDLWSPETWYHYGNALRNSIHSDSLATQCYISANYILPRSDMISREQAIEIALDSVNLPHTIPFVAFCCKEGEKDIWKIVTHTLDPEDIGSGKYSETWMIEMDGTSGKILNKSEWCLGKDKAILMYVPLSVYNAVYE